MQNILYTQKPWLAALPSDQTEIRLGKIYRNDEFEALLDVLNQRRKKHARQTMEVVQVPAGEVFLLGDWRANSNDSRAVGAVSLDNILGKVVAVWLSSDFDRVGRLEKPIILQQR